MARDRSVRLLGALGGASTSRVFNLHRIALDHGQDPEYRQKPLFASPVINRCFVLKHRTRTDEAYLFASPRTVSTKIIVPFDNADLKAGGYGMFVDQRGYRDMLRNAGHYNGEALDRDMTVLKLLNMLPSLDPFLLREHLRNNGIEVASCYFAISEGDRDRMQRFAEAELSRLVLLAGEEAGASKKLVTAMLSSQVDEKLEPLRVTLNLIGEDFREGVFSWRGFLYYKWSMTDFWPDVMRTLRELNTAEPHGAVSFEQKTFLADSRRTIIQMVQGNGDAVNRALAVYDDAFSDLVANQSPGTFRDFLLSAPRMFLEMGEKLGAISHIVSFWRYRFPPGSRANIDAEELSTIVADFIDGFGERGSEKRPLHRPKVTDRTGAGGPAAAKPG